MAYSLKYTIPFANVDNIPCVVNIEQKNYSGVSTELQAGANPFVVTTDDNDFVYTPKRFSTAKINIVGSDYLRELYSTSYQEYRVTFYRNNVIEWCGFIKPETYTQDYVTETFELEIECISAMSTLEYIDYSLKDTSKQFVSLYYLIQKCIQSANANYSTVIIPYVYSDSKDNYTNKALDVLSTMTVLEQDFFDEDGTAMKLNEVLENVCKLLSWTCVDYKGSLYFVDYDHNGEYFIYSGNFVTKTGSISPKTMSVQDIGFKGGDHTLDILGGYSKVKVKDSNYNANEAIPNEEYSQRVKMQMIDGEAVFTSPHVTLDDGTEEFWVEQAPKVYKCYDKSDKGIIGDTFTSNKKKVRDFFLGSKIVRTSNYKTNDKSFSYDNCIELCIGSAKLVSDNNYQKYSIQNTTEPILTYNVELPCMCISDGCIYITGSVAQSVDFVNGEFSSNIGSKVHMALICYLQIGNKRWSGARWEVVDSNSERVNSFTVSIDTESYGFNSIIDTKTVYQPYDASGYIIPLPEEPLYGPIIFKMFVPDYFNAPSCEWSSIYIKDFEIKFAKNTSISSNTDRTYENVVNGDYVNESDNIEFKISSYNDDGPCYSKVMLGDKYLTNNLYSVIEDKLVRPEEALIRRIINRYSSAKIKLTQQIQFDSSLLPIDTLSDSYFVNKKFLNAGGDIDYSIDRLECKMIEQ